METLMGDADVPPMRLAPARRTDLAATNRYLRRLTRSFGAGEMTVEEFRLRRRAAIERGCSEASRPCEDLTLPRAQLGERPPVAIPAAGVAWRSRAAWRRDLPPRLPLVGWALGAMLGVAALVMLVADARF